MYLDLMQKINQYEITKFDDPIFNDPAQEDVIQELIEKSEQVLQYTPCDEYLDLLRLTNGYDNCNDDGVDFFTASDFVGFNLDWRELNGNDCIIFGSMASIPIYLYNQKAKHYIISDRDYFPSKNDKYFNTFGELVSASLNDRVSEII